MTKLKKLGLKGLTNQDDPTYKVTVRKEITRERLYGRIPMRLWDLDIAG